MKKLACKRTHSLMETEVNYLCHLNFKTSSFYSLTKIQKKP